jgi:RNA polymerase sigma-70 factor (ECF subfamily)
MFIEKVNFFLYITGTNIEKRCLIEQSGEKHRASNLNFSIIGKSKGQDMFFSKSITLDQGDLGGVASAARIDAAQIEFIEKLKTGDAAAFDTLVIRYSGDVYALLFRLTENAEEAGDLTQETFLSALKAINRFRGEADLKTWLFRIAVNESRNRFRWWKRRNRHNTISLDAPTASGEQSLHETLSGNAANPEENALRHERETALKKALRNLPDIFREAIILCDIEGLSYEEISVALEINIGTVKSRIARGRDELRRKLEGL